MDETPELYALALSAQKEPLFQGNRVDVDIEFKAWAVVAHSSAEATSKGLAVALERWPESEGWSKHSVSLSVLERDFLRESLLEIDTFGVEDASDDDDDSLPM
jgi:hypothetical protein